MRLSRLILPAFVICSLVIGHCSFATAKEFDGIWFLGFNTKAVPFDRVAVRQAVAHSLNVYYISRVIMSEEAAPAGLIPPGMNGYDPQLKTYKFNPQYAKTLMKKAGYKLNSPQLKNLPLLHTDGAKTVEIARQVQKDLKKIGLKIDLVKVSYRDTAKWNTELRSGKYPFFLLGYKAEVDRLFTAEASSNVPDSAKLIAPLFGSTGEANFTGYSQSFVDLLLDRIAQIDPSLASERGSKLLLINRQLYRDIPAIVLFYIEKI